MSSSPKTVDTEAVSDPLAEALDRLERSMAGGVAIPEPVGEGPARPSAAPRERGELPPPAPPTDAQRPRISRTPVAPAPEPGGAEAGRRAVVADELPAGRGERGSTSATSVPTPVEVETWTPPVDKASPAAAAPAVGRRPQHVPTWEEVTASPPPEQRREPVVAPGGRGETPPEPAEDISHRPEVRHQSVESARHSGNRRAPSGPHLLPLLLIFVLLQAGVFAVAVVWVWPKLKQDVIDDAAVAAQGGRELADILQRRLGANESSLGEIRDDVAALSRKVDVSPGEAWRELDYLGARNRLLEFADRAIQQADRDALAALKAAAADAADEKLRDGAKAEVARVGAAYAVGLRAGSHTLPVGQLFPALRQKNERELGSDQLIQVLRDAGVRPEYRAKAAYLLADHRSGHAADALAKAIATDRHLDVVREACLTFCEMTGYRTADHLDWDAVARWWAVNRIRVKSVLGGQ